jgi:surface polysaccharide O-acyltransferase-like enzyme
MVILVHATVPFYLGGEGSLILTKMDAFWASPFDSMMRACVPIFIVASSYLQFPLHYSSGEFFRRRAVRVLMPFLLWSSVYALAWGEPSQNFQNLLFNFNYSAGHLWFVYMLIGVYLLMPLLSPWAERVGKRELQAYLVIWGFTLLIPIIRDWYSGGGENLLVTYGVGGLPRQALTPFWGEASWNTYGTFYYLSGFIGYLLLGLYLRRFVGELSWRKTLAIATPCYLAGFAIVFGGFLWRVFESCGGEFPAAGLVEKAIWWETTWTNDTIGVALMTIAWLLLFKKIKCNGSLYKSALLPVSKASYGIYLLHLLVLVPISGAVREWLGIGLDGKLGIWTTPVEILLAALLGFVGSAIIAVTLQRVPKIGKYIIG